MKVHDDRLFVDDRAPVPFRPSPNHGGALDPRFLVMHYTAGRSAQSSAGWLCDPRAKASAHLVIGRDGQVIQLVPFRTVAWHAGVSAWHDGVRRWVGMNNHAISIELDNPGRLVRTPAGWRSLSLGTEYAPNEAIEATHKNETRPAGWCLYPQAQLEVAFEVAALLVETYRLVGILGHDDVAPSRKTDPGPAFPLQSFQSRLFGRADDHADDQYQAQAALNVRVGPGTQYAALPAGPLPAGTRVQVLLREGSWCQVDVLDAVAGINDLQGWVHGRFLRPVA
jgi:N-acetylmuramoyl-L-alanine amidase